jgi:murein DD-endopeptidase MepM/ murein hydrolase activator NlpD
LLVVNELVQLWTALTNKIMIRKAPAYQSSSEQNWGNFLVHHLLLLKVVTWLSSISLLASANISGAEIKPIAIAPIRQSLMPTRLTPVVRPLPMVSSNKLLPRTNNVPKATLSPTANSKLQIQFKKPQSTAPVIPGAVAIYVAPPQSTVISSKVVEPLSQIPQVKKLAIPNLAPIPTVHARSTTPTSRLSSYGLDSNFVYPLANPAPETSRFGWRVHPISGNRRFHAGIDLGAPAGAPIIAAATGRVVVANWHGGYGKAVVIEHNGQLQTLYGHMSEIFVQVGQEIKQGAVIGLVGSTGNSTGPHLHFETHIATNDGWIAVDPNQEVQLALHNLRQSIQSYRQNTVTSNQL